TRDIQDPKSEVQCSQLTRLTEECPSTCSKVLPSSVKKKDYERPQPVKIAQLIKQSKNLKSAQKSTGRKKILPERLGSTRSRKKERVSDQSTCTNRRVRRVLNFNEITANTLENNNEIESQLKIKDKLVTDVLIHDKVCKSVKKQSLLVVPNSIKNKHLQRYNGKVSRYSKIPEVTKEINETDTDCIVRKKNEIINESFDHGNEQKNVRSSNYMKSTSCAMQRFVPPSQCKTQQQVRVNNKNQLFVPNNVKSKTFIKSIKEDDCVQNLSNDLQNTTLVASASDSRVKHKLPDMICVSKDQIIQLECNLKDLLKETEKNAIKLKSSLTFIASLLVVNDQEVAHNINDDSKKRNNTMIDQEVQVEICCKSFQCSSAEKFETPTMNTPTNVQPITVQSTEFLNKNALTRNDEDNKENVEDLNISNMSDTATDGSFLELENQLNIIHTKPAENNLVQPKVPMVTRHKQNRSLREYMALKSSISFLLTPDSKKFRSLCQIDNTDKSMFSIKSISNKLLGDLHNLYSDSPES
ncbi:uncharacterized protein LOC143432248, partial [Xylocopa sonorina]|uniref:uncharacterized protein LOC143432248 n=1 Tax=Xylocopa sonorina TaxID=1818115 RepID=UPI00403AC02E